jgi:hypothetical protein
MRSSEFVVNTEVQVAESGSSRMLREEAQAGNYCAIIISKSDVGLQFLFGSCLIIPVESASAYLGPVSEQFTNVRCQLQ